MSTLDIGDLPESREAKVELVRALFARPDIPEAGRAALRATHPHAPSSFLDAAAFHLYVDLPGALLDMLALVELTLREPGRGLGYGGAYHALYHLYNWMQFDFLRPEGIADLDECLKDAERELEDGDIEALRASLKELRARLDANLSAPDLEPGG